MCTYVNFFPPYFSCPFCRVSIFVFLTFSFVFTKLKAYTVCARAHASICTVFWRFSQRNCQIVEEVWTLSGQVVKSKDLRRQTKEWMAVFFNIVCEKCYRKCCRYMRNKPTRQKGKKKKLQLHNIKASSITVWRYVTNEGWKALKRKKVVHTSWWHGIRRICKLYTKGRPDGKLTWREFSRDHLDYRWWDNMQRSSPQKTVRAKTVTTLRLKKCELRHALGARTFYTSPLNRCQKS